MYLTPAVKKWMNHECVGIYVNAALMFSFPCSYSTECRRVCAPLQPWPQLIVSHCRCLCPPSSFISNYSLSLSLSLPFGLPLRFIAWGRQTAKKPPCMERSVISTLSAKHTAFHIVLQALGQIAIFMGHDKGNATLCSHFLLPDVRVGACCYSLYWKLVCVVCDVCVCGGVLLGG